MSLYVQPISFSTERLTTWQWSENGIILSIFSLLNNIFSHIAHVALIAWQTFPWLIALSVIGILLIPSVALRSIQPSVARRQKMIKETLDTLPDAVALFSQSGKLTVVNDKLHNLLPVRIKSALHSGMSIDEFYALISPAGRTLTPVHRQTPDTNTDSHSTISFELPSYGHRSLLIKERDTDDGGKCISIYNAPHYFNNRLSDPLTALANRTRLVHELTQRCSTQGELSLIIVDLRSFRQINDSYGRPAGDELLKQTAICLKQAMPENALIARTGGDEFAILLESGPSRKTTENLVTELLQTLRSGLNVHAMNVPVRASVGIAYAPEHGNTVSALLKSADSACAHAKHVGDNTVVVFNSTQQKQAKRRHQLEIELQQAIEKKELSLQYQPQIDIKSKMTFGMEALVRWQNEEFGHVSPVDFIPVAEETGIINRLGEWVLSQAIADYQRLARYGTSPSMLSVNLSRKQFEGGKIATDVAKLLSRTGFNPSRLCLEITETALFSDSTRLQKQLLELNSLGVRLAIDDFGVGYSSLRELRDYPIAEVKIDRAFVVNISTDTHSQDIISAIVDISRSIGVEVVAEGIENQQQFDMVAQLGCDRAQGYFLCEPMAATTFPDVVLRR